MTMPYQIITDSSCDLPQELADSFVLPLSLTVDHKTYKNYLDGREIGFHELYEKFRSGSQTSTCAVNPEAFIEVMEPCLKEGRDIFYIGFSSGLSTTYQSGVIAASELREKYPDTCITIPMLDNPDARSLNLSNSAAIIIYEALRQLDFAGLKNFHH